MNRVMLAIGILLFVGGAGLAQHGTAPPGYYPIGYAGDTWTGTVTAVNDTTREITLTYTKGNKTETFVGFLEEGYKVKLKDGSSRELKPSDILIGTHLIVYYIPKTKRVGDKKVRISEIFELAKLPDGKK